MIIWIAALLFFALAGMVGFYLGMVRVAFSLVGLIVASLLACPLGHFTYPILGWCGIVNPVYLWLCGPVVAFAAILIAFKMVGFGVSHQVSVYYKYKAGDLKLGLWERLTARVGLCLALVNAAIYLILISLVFYVLSYPTSQILLPDSPPPGAVKIINQLGQAVRDSHMDKIVATIDPMPKSYYTAAEIVGLIYHNDLLESRLSRYPAFLSLGEKGEFQDIANDKEFNEFRMRQPTFMELVNHGKSQEIINNPDLLHEIWSIAEPNLDDLLNYLKTGQSAIYDNDKVLGRWDFNVSGAVYLVKQNSPNILSAQMSLIRRALRSVFGTTTLVAAPDKSLLLKHFGTVKKPSSPKAPPTVDYSNLTGQWSSTDSEGTNYTFSLSGIPGAKGPLKVAIDGDRMTITGAKLPNGTALPLRFDRQY